MLRPTTRLAAGALVLALPLAAAAGCGAEKKRTIKAEFASASENLQNSKSVSFSLSLRDSKGALASLAKKDQDSDTKSVIDSVFKGRITVTIDPAGAKTFADLSTKADCTTSTKDVDISAALKKVNLSIAVADAVSTVGEIRLVDGTLYAHVDLKEIGAVATKGGVEDFDGQVDDAIDSADPKLASALTDARSGKWLSLPVTKYIDKFKDLASSFTQQYESQSGTSLATSCADTQKAGKDVFAAVKPYVKVTDANDSSSNRVLDVNVKVRPALKAALAVLKSAKGLPFGDLFSSVEPTDVDDSVADGTAKGTITLKSGHLTQLAVDIDSIRTLDPQAGKTSVAGSAVVLDIDDSAGEVTVPSDVSTFDVGALVDDFLDSLTNAGDSTGVSIAG